MIAILVSITILKALTAYSAYFREYVTPHIVRHVRRQMWVSTRLQNMRSPGLTRVVTMSANTVCVEFFAVSLPVLAWCVARNVAGDKV